MKRSPVAALISATLALAAPAGADLVDVGNGVTLEGLVSAGAGDQLNLQVSDGGYITLERSSVVSVRLQTSAQNERLHARWKTEGRVAAAAEAAERRRDEAARREDQGLAARRAKLGLTLLDGEWLTPAQLEARAAEERALREAAEVAATRAYAEEQTRAAIAKYMAYAVDAGPAQTTPTPFSSPGGSWATLGEASVQPTAVTDYASLPPGFGFSKVGLSTRHIGLGPIGPPVLFDREAGVNRR